MTVSSPSAERYGVQSATVSARMVRDREVSAVEMTSAALDRIAGRDKTVRAFCTVDAEQALLAAREIDARIAQGKDPGPLAGVPVAVKDLIPTAGLRTTYGSELYRDHIPAQDDICVARLRHAGAVIIGKTNTSEFGYGPVSHNALFPPTRNPWDPSLSPGGSSAGSAAAVAMGLVPVALGSDGGGSIRVPAALCGTMGFKPSWGRVPIFPSCRDEAAPGVSGWESLEHVGPLTRSAADAALVMSVIAGPDARDRHSIPCSDLDWLAAGRAGPIPGHMAFSATLGYGVVDDHVAEIAARAVEVFRKSGCDVVEATPAIGDPQPAFEAIVALDTDRAGLRRLAREQGVAFGTALSAILTRDWTADEFAAALLVRKRVCRIIGAFLAEHRFLLTPTTACPAFPLADGPPAMIKGRAVADSGWAPFSTIANLAGLPAVTVPAGRTAQGKPVGLQIMGRHLDDFGVLQAAALFEAQTPCWEWPV